MSTAFLVFSVSAPPSHWAEPNSVIELPFGQSFPAFLGTVKEVSFYRCLAQLGGVAAVRRHSQGIRG